MLLLLCSSYSWAFGVLPFQFTWPEFLASSEVNVEDFWATMETEVIEQVAFPASIPITKFDASVVAPFFPPLMRGAVVVNTEKDKNLDVPPAPGKAAGRCLASGRAPSSLECRPAQTVGGCFWKDNDEL